MNNLKKFLILLCIVLPISTSACTATVSITPTPSPAATATSVPTATPTPTVVPTATPTEAATSTPTDTPTVTPTLAPSSTPTRRPTVVPTTTPTPPPTADPIPDRQTYSNKRSGFSIAYPGSWQVTDRGASMTMASPDLATSNRTQGAELIVVVGSPKRPDEPLQVEWETAVAAFPEVTYGEASVVKIGGEDAYRALFTDPRDGSHGWFILLRRGGLMYVIVAQTYPVDAWATYEDIFRAMLSTFWFSQ